MTIQYTNKYVSEIAFGVDVDAAQAEISFADKNGGGQVVVLMSKDEYATPVLAITTAAMVASASLTIWVTEQKDSEGRHWLTSIRLDNSGLPN